MRCFSYTIEDGEQGSETFSGHGRVITPGDDLTFTFASG